MAFRLPFDGVVELVPHRWPRNEVLPILEPGLRNRGLWSRQHCTHSLIGVLHPWHQWRFFDGKDAELVRLDLPPQLRNQYLQPAWTSIHMRRRRKTGHHRFTSVKAATCCPEEISDPVFGMSRAIDVLGFPRYRTDLAHTVLRHIRDVIFETFT